MKSLKLFVATWCLISISCLAPAYSADDPEEMESEIKEKIDQCESKESTRQIISCLSWILARYTPFFGSGHGMMMDLIKRRIDELTEELRR